MIRQQLTSGLRSKSGSEHKEIRIDDKLTHLPVN